MNRRVVKPWTVEISEYSDYITASTLQNEFAAMMSYRSGLAVDQIVRAEFEGIEAVRVPTRREVRFYSYSLVPH